MDYNLLTDIGIYSEIYEDVGLLKNLLHASAEGEQFAELFIQLQQVTAHAQVSAFPGRLGKTHCTQADPFGCDSVSMCQAGKEASGSFTQVILQEFIVKGED